MIVRIMGEGQYDLDDAHHAELNVHDNALTAALDVNDELAFRTALESLLETVRSNGQRLPDDELAPSDVVLPHPGATLHEVHGLLGSEGLVSGT